MSTIHHRHMSKQKVNYLGFQSEMSIGRGASISSYKSGHSSRVIPSDLRKSPVVAMYLSTVDLICIKVFKINFLEATVWKLVGG